MNQPTYVCINEFHSESLERTSKSLVESEYLARAVWKNFYMECPLKQFKSTIVL